MNSRDGPYPFKLRLIQQDKSIDMKDFFDRDYKQKATDDLNKEFNAVRFDFELMFRQEKTDMRFDIESKEDALKCLEKYTALKSLTEERKERAYIYMGYEDQVMVDEGQKYFDTILSEEERSKKIEEERRWLDGKQRG